MAKANAGNKRGVYKLQAGDIIYYRIGNGVDDAKERLHAELEKALGSSVLVPEIKVLHEK